MNKTRSELERSVVFFTDRTEDDRLERAPKFLSGSQIRAIADALGDTEEGLTGSEIAFLLTQSRIIDTDPTTTKRHRLHNAFANAQNTDKSRVKILAFIRFAMKPERYLREPGRYEPLRAKLNKALLFAGLAVDECGQIVATEAARSLSEAQRRASELRSDLEIVGVHSEVLRFCREELLADNYFHAVLEAAKSIADRLRTKTGMTSDGATLVDHVLGGTPPLLAINDWVSETDRSEQRGFANLVKGVFGMFRNTTAHAPKISWAVNKNEAAQVLSLISMVHRRLDNTIMPPRA